MEHVAPLLQTLLWVVLIGGIVIWANKPLHGILTALHKRIDGGSEIKAGPFSLIEPLRPQLPDEQRQKLEQEAEVLDAEQPTDLPPAIDGLDPESLEQQPQTEGERRSTRRAMLAQMPVLSEDLVLRLIQSEYGVPVQRQVTGGKDSGFDGVFTSPMGRVSVIEVKFISDGAAPKSWPRIRESVVKLSHAVHSYGWQSPQLIVAIVFENADDIESGLKLMNMDGFGASGDIVIRTFSYDELVRRFRHRVAGNRVRAPDVP
jgi:hypothetical protein